jgi:hypothetical protein
VGIVVGVLAGLAFCGVLYSYFTEEEKKVPVLNLDDVDDDLGGLDSEKAAPRRGSLATQLKEDGSNVTGRYWDSNI